MTNPTRAGKIVFEQLQGLPASKYRSLQEIAIRAGYSTHTVHRAFHNIRTVLGPIHGEPLVWIKRGNTYFYRLSNSAQEVIDYNAVSLAGIITRLRVQADVAEAGYTKTGAAQLLSTADGLRMMATSITGIRDRLLAAPRT